MPKYAVYDKREKNTKTIINVINIDPASEAEYVTELRKKDPNFIVQRLAQKASKGDRLNGNVVERTKEPLEKPLSLSDVKTNRLNVINTLWKEIFFDLRISENAKNSFKTESIQAVSVMGEATNLQEIKQALQYLKKYDFVKADYKAL